MPPTVSLARCADYDRARVRAAVREAMALLPGMAERLARKPRVLLKPNLLSSNDPPERAVNTHPEFVRAAAEYFLAAGCAVRLGDSCGCLAPGSTRQAIAMTGLDRVAAELGVEVLDFDRAPSEERHIPNGRILHAVRVPQALRETDLLVTLPKFKTHGLTMLTGAVKNQLGLVPGNGKKEIHLLAPKPHLMAEALLDIHSVVRPALALMDGIVGMEGNGPAAGPARPVGLVLASDDGLALDAVVAAVMGFGPGEVDLVRLGHERGLGVGELARIAVAGLPLAEARVPGFVRPPVKVSAAVMKLLPSFLMRWAFDTVGATYATILDDRCVRCGVCIGNCPARALKKVNGRVRAEQARCIGCYCCAEVCEKRAIRMRRPLAGRLVHGLAHFIQGRKP